jgi:hypothetical protein
VLSIIKKKNFTEDDDTESYDVSHMFKVKNESIINTNINSNDSKMSEKYDQLIDKIIRVEKTILENITNNR